VKIRIAFRDVDLGTATSVLADADGLDVTDHNRTPVRKPQVEGAPQECPFAIASEIVVAEKI